MVGWDARAALLLPLGGGGFVCVAWYAVGWCFDGVFAGWCMVMSDEFLGMGLTMLRYG